MQMNQTHIRLYFKQQQQHNKTRNRNKSTLTIQQKIENSVYINITNSVLQRILERKMPNLTTDQENAN